MNSNKYRIVKESGADDGFILLESWNSKLLLEKGATFFTDKPKNRLKLRTPPGRAYQTG